MGGVLKIPCFHETEMIKQRGQYLFLFTHQLCPPAGALAELISPAAQEQLRSA